MENGPPLVDPKRGCPQTHCDGSLDEQDDGTLLCHQCFCTASGDFINPGPLHDSTVHPTTWDELLEDHNGDRETYRIEDTTTRLIGGFEKPWPHEWLSREDSLI